MCMVVYARRRLSVMKGRRIKVVKARGLTSEVVLPPYQPQEDESVLPLKKIGRFLSWELISILKELPIKLSWDATDIENQLGHTGA